MSLFVRTHGKDSTILSWCFSKLVMIVVFTGQEVYIVGSPIRCMEVLVQLKMLYCWDPIWAHSNLWWKEGNVAVSEISVHKLQNIMVIMGLFLSESLEEHTSFFLDRWRVSPLNSNHCKTSKLDNVWFTIMSLPLGGKNREVPEKLPEVFSMLLCSTIAT